MKALSLAIVLIAGWPAVAAAHPIPGVNDFYVGMLHPLTTIEFLLPLVALSLLSGGQDRGTAIGMLATIPLSLLAGAIVALVAPVPDSVRWIPLVSMAVVGGLVAAAAKMPVAVAVALSAVIGAAIGWANGTDVGERISAIRYIPGVSLAGFLLAAYGIGCVRAIRIPWVLIAFRVLGSWISAVGILFLGLK